MSMSVFPVLGGAKYTNDWHAPRAGHLHQGNDLFGPVGRPLLAVEAGAVRFGTDPLGGNIANLRTADGTRYYYAHLDRFEGTNRDVLAGEVIGYLGKTGNAATTDPHLHFEVHPAGGAAVNPFPLLSQVKVQQSPGTPPIIPPAPPAPSAPPIAHGASGRWALGVLAVTAYLGWRYRGRWM